MGFDRLVAMASEVDKRSKSAENSPAHNSPRKGEGRLSSVVQFHAFHSNILIFHSTGNIGPRGVGSSQRSLWEKYEKGKNFRGKDAKK
jgi:hypothetical protein